MRLSEAIRLGAMTTGSGKYTYIKQDTDGVLRTCALGAAMYACGFVTNGIGMHGEGLCAVVGAVEITWPFIYNRPMNIPKEFYDLRGQSVGLTINTVLIVLNDAGNWTRERIADWVESEERAYEPAVIPDTDPACYKTLEPGRELCSCTA